VTVRRWTLCCLCVAAALLGLAVSSAFAFSPDNPVRDNFNRADGALGANWNAISGDCTPTIASNAVAGCGTGTTSGEASFVTSYAADMEAYVTVTAVTASSNFVGVGIRTSSGNSVSCTWKGGSNVFDLGSGSGPSTSIGTQSDTLSAGDKIAVWASANYVECDRFTGGVWVPEVGARAPGAFNRAGLAMMFVGSGFTVDDFGAGPSSSGNPPGQGYVSPVSTVTTTVFAGTTTQNVYTGQATVTIGGGGAVAMGGNCGGTTTNDVGSTVAQAPCQVDISNGTVFAGFLNNVHDDLFVLVGAILGAALIPMIVRWFTAGKE
jgi:hypothetical protein